MDRRFELWNMLVYLLWYRRVFGAGGGHAAATRPRAEVQDENAGPQAKRAREVSMQAVVDETRRLLRVAGEEAAQFLQGLVTVDVESLAPGQARHGALLTPQGKLFADFTLWHVGDGQFLLDVDASRAPLLARRLALYRLRARVEIGEPADDPRVVVLPGVEPTALGLSLVPGEIHTLEGAVRLVVDPRLPALGLRALVPQAVLDDFLARFQLTRAGADVWAQHRLALGVAEGAELPWERIFALEANLSALGAVDFNKGCYIGQEVTARMRHRTRPKKRLLPVRLAGEAPVPSPVVTAAGHEVGELRARVGDRGLALLRLEPLSRPESYPLRADSAELTPIWPAWLEEEEQSPLQPPADGL